VAWRDPAPHAAAPQPTPSTTLNVTTPPAPVDVRRSQELKALRVRLKSGDYNGADIMQAWLALDELIAQQPSADARDAAIGKAYLRWYGAAKGYREIDVDAAHKTILHDAARRHRSAAEDNPMTADKVGELEALLAKATPLSLQVPQLGGNPWIVALSGRTTSGDYVRNGCILNMTAHDQANLYAELIVKAVNALPELLRVYRAWEGAEVGELVRSHACNDDFALRGDNNYPVDLFRYAGTRVRLVPDGGDDQAQGGR